jgi:AcrR family transcriptional regulator
MNIQYMKVTDKREAILTATMQLITEHGFHATPMSMVAKQAGVAAGTIYHYFSSKEELINQLYAELKQKMGAALLQNDAGSSNIRERFFRFYRNLYAHFIQHPDEFGFLEQYANSPYITQASKEQNQQFYKPVVDFLLQGMELGVLRSMEQELITALVYGHVVSVAKLQLSGQLEITDTRLEQAIQSCWDGVKIN